jgi:hypothetical protein
MMLAALVLAASVHAEPAQRVFAAGDKAAAVYEDRIEFFTLPADSVVTVGGHSAFGPLPGRGNFLVAPVGKPTRVLHVGKKITVPVLPERNGARFLACNGRGDGDAGDNVCGVFNVDGRQLFGAPDADNGQSVDALALSTDGKQAIFEYRKGNDVESYLVWTEGAKQPKSYKADVKDMELRRTLNRFGLNDWNPEPDKKPKPGAHNP